MRYIDADKLQEEFKESHGGKRSLLIDTQPTADVVEVVRCKNCKHRKKNTFCLYNMRYEDDNGFCSYGERGKYEKNN